MSLLNFVPKSNTTDTIQKRINTLNKRHNKNEINVEDFLNALSLLIVQKK
jgi:Ca2+-binding EF-hand superfamily protein